MPRYQYQHRKPQRRKVKFGRVVLIIALLMVLAYPFFEAFHLNVKEYTTSTKNLPSNLRNLKVVYLTDIHQNTWDTQKRTNNIIKTVNSLSPDLVLLGGDYAMDVESAVSFFEAMPLIQARLGAFGVVGSYDRGESDDDLRRLELAMKDAGVTPLVNEVTSVKVGKATLYIAGLDDPAMGDPDVEGVARQVSGDDFVILLANDPDLLNDVVTAVDKNGKKPLV